MKNTKHQILNKKQIEQKIYRLAYEVYRDNFDEKEIILAAIAPRGYVLASKLQKVIAEISPLKVTLAQITVEKDSSELKANLDIPLQSCHNQSIIIVDDVLHTGKTLIYGLGVFINIPTKKVRTVVLVDRSHKLYPIATDFAGIELSTSLHEHVSVIMDGEDMAVYLA